MRLNKLSLMVLAAALMASAVAVRANQITIATVPVGDAGNAVDPTTGYGAVSYNYNIGTYEVTAGQYTAFLSAVGGVDTYGLYNTTMSRTDYGSGITRSGDGTSDNPYTYSVDSNFTNRPVNYVSYWDSCRFANWLNNGQQTTAQDSTTTEHGAYTLTTDEMNNNTIVRNTNWKWAVTSEDEWYKAAYYDPNKPGVAGYWKYPTKSNTEPGRDLADASGNNANYYGTPYPIDSGKCTTVVGEFQNSPSPYDTFDQGGNVWEWNEAITSGSWRGLRGGSFDNQPGYLASSLRGYYPPTYPLGTYIGFRVTSVPEPSTLALLGIGVLGLLGYGWRRRKQSA